MFTREQLLSEVWGYDYFGGTRTVDVHVRRLRAKLGDLESLIGTVRNVGYRFNVYDDDTERLTAPAVRLRARGWGLRVGARVVGAGWVGLRAVGPRLVRARLVGLRAVGPAAGEAGAGSARGAHRSSTGVRRASAILRRRPRRTRDRRAPTGVGGAGRRNLLADGG